MDSFIINIKDFYKDIANEVEKDSIHNYEVGRPLPIGKNKK